LFDPAPGSDDEEMSEELMGQMAEELPRFVEFLAAVVHDDSEDETLGWCDDQTEFEFAVDLLLDGLERMRLDV
jgi:hypothetical protein